MNLLMKMKRMVPLILELNNDRTTRSKSFEYMTKLIGSTPNNTGRLSPEIVVPSKDFEVLKI